MSRTIEPLPLDETFSREYEIEWIRDMPSSRATSVFGHGGGPILRVTPHDGKPFIAVVPGQTGSMTLSTWPNPRQFAVFNWQDVPIIVDIDEPERFIKIDDFDGHGLRGRYLFQRPGVVVMASCCHLVAYNAKGKIWDRHGLFCCDERSISRTEDVLIVDPHSDAHGAVGRKVVDVSTGELIS